MAAMTTALTVFDTEGSTRVYSVDAHHSVAAPFLIKQKRHVPDPSKGQVVQEDVISIYAVTTNELGAVMAQKEAATITFKRPFNGNATVRSNVMAVLLDLAASDELAAVQSGSANLK